MADNYVSNKVGNRINPSTEDKQRDVETCLEEIKLQNVDLVNNLAAEPLVDETQELTNASADTDTEVAVEAGGVYVFTAFKTGGFYLGVADTQTAKNVRWVAPLYQTVLIKIPAGETALHFATDTNSGIGYLRRLA